MSWSPRRRILTCVTALAATVLLFGYRAEQWTLCAVCWSTSHRSELGLGCFGATLPLSTSFDVSTSRALRNGRVPLHGHVTAPGHGHAYMKGGLLAGGYIACGDPRPSEFAREYETDEAFARFIDTGAEDGSIDATAVAALIGAPDWSGRDRVGWSRDEEKRSLLRRGAELVATFRGTAAQAIRLWRGADPFEAIPPERAPGRCCTGR